MQLRPSPTTNPPSRINAVVALLVNREAPTTLAVPLAAVPSLGAASSRPLVDYDENEREAGTCTIQ